MKLFAHKSRPVVIQVGADLQNTPNSAISSDNSVPANVIQTGRARLSAIAAVFLTIFVVISLRLLDLSVLDRVVPRPLAAPEARTGGLSMARTDITDRNGIVLATSLPTVSLYARTEDVQDPVEATNKLMSVLPDFNREDLLAKLSNKRPFVYLRRNLTPHQQYEVNFLGIPGLDFEEGEKRIYPHGNLAAHVIGMTDVDNNGIAGVEKKFNATLHKGQAPLRLSIDIRVQTVLRAELARAVSDFSALGAAGMVVDVRTGEVLAMVSLPDYDPNDPSTGAGEAMFNRVSKGSYEMGSTFKLFNTAMALESGRVNMNSTFDCTKSLEFAGHTIHDDHPLRRWAGVSDILVTSSNVGSARMALQAGTDNQKAFMERLGMLRSATIELPEVGAPRVPNPWREINTITIAFGHGMAVTPVQMVQGVSALVNGGILIPLTIQARDLSQPIPGERVIKQATSDQMRNLMRLVVTEGTGKKANVPGYDVGGKTGTAEKAGRGGYRKKAVLASFIGAFPMKDPRYAILASIDEPKGTKETAGFITAGWNATPTAGRIIAQVAPLLGELPHTEGVVPPVVRPTPAPAPRAAKAPSPVAPSSDGGREIAEAH